jgi:hypothetical protein
MRKLVSAIILATIALTGQASETKTVESCMVVQTMLQKEGSPASYMRIIYYDKLTDRERFLMGYYRKSYSYERKIITLPNNCTELSESVLIETEEEFIIRVRDDIAKLDAQKNKEQQERKAKLSKELGL